MEKRLIALLLCLVMCVSLLPAQAFAEEEITNDLFTDAGEPAIEEPASIGDDAPDVSQEEPSVEEYEAEKPTSEDHVAEELEDLEVAEPSELDESVIPADREEPRDPSIGEAESTYAAEKSPEEDDPFIAPGSESTEDTDAEGEESDELQSYTPGGSSEGLLDGYARMMLASLLPGGDGLLNVKNVGATLEGATKEAYDKLRPMIAQVAAGERTSTVFSYTRTVSGTIEFHLLLQALKTDCPYEMYWMNMHEASWIKAGSVVEISLPVAVEYAAGTYEVDPSKGAAVNHAVSKAAAIVSEYSGCSDYEKLEGYKNEICDLVDYNHEAADDDTTLLSNPWQLIWIFDEDPDTKVVCAGYAKGFQYLCDLTEFSGNVTAYCVTGDVPSGFHMWDIVQMDNGKNYMVDVTWCDGGWPLFMVGYASGSVDKGYTFTWNSSTVTYIYGEDTCALFDKSDLSLSFHNYLDDPNGDMLEPPEEMKPVDISDWSLPTLEGGTVTQDSFVNCMQLLVFYRATMTDGGAACRNSASTIESLARCGWISDPGIKIVAVDVDGNDAATVEAFKSRYAPGCSDIVFALKGETLMWSIAQQIGNPKSVPLTICTLFADGRPVDYWTGNTSADTCLEHIAMHQSDELVDSGTCGANLSWTLDVTGKLTISGTGAMTDYNAENLPPWYSERNSIKTAVIQFGVTNIGYFAFYDCDGLTSVMLPASVTNIGYFAFYDCDGLTSVTLPTSLTTIGSYVFQYCSSLSSLTIPSSVISIGLCPFSDCSSLTAINVDSKNRYYCSRDGVLFWKDMTYLVSFPGGRNGEYTIPNGVTQIGHYAFQGCGGLTGIMIPEGMTSIGFGAFYDCNSLTNVTLPGSVTSISTNAFCNCSSLVSITIPEGVSSIADGTFYGCSSLTNVTIPDGVTNIDSYAFYGCSSLVSITIPEGVSSIADGTFLGCSSLTNVTIPDSVTNIDSRAFYGCSSLASIKIPSGVTSISNGTFYGCSSLTSVAIPDGVTSIDNYAFNGCTALTDVYYGGTLAQRETLINHGWDTRGNELFFGAIWHYQWDGTNHIPSSPVRENEVAATCTEDGSYDEVVFCVDCGKELSRERHSIPALGHDYECVDTIWDGHDEVSFSFICRRDSNHTLTLPALITSERTEPSCEQDGSIVYTASVTASGSTYTDSRTETLPALGHEYRLSDWNWSGYSAATAVFTCTHDASHRQSAAATITSVRTEPTAQTDGKVEYTATASFEGRTYTNTKTEVLRIDRSPGWQQIDGKWYFFDDSGKPKTGWVKSGSSWFYMGTDGDMQTGLIKVSGKLYYMSSSGAMQTGWKQIDGRWYYFQSGGAAATGWLKSGSSWYYFDTDCVMVTGWQEIGGKKYYFNASGAMKTGWLSEEGNWYYFQGSGAMATGWVKVGSTWYYFDSDGVMVTGLREIGGKKYYFASSGAMKTGWLKLDNKWYYFESSGAMKTGWLKLDGKWYYLDADGVMLANTSRKIGSKVYYFNASGVCTNP